MNKRRAFGSGFVATATFAGLLSVAPVAASAANQSDNGTFSMTYLDDGGNWDPAVFSYEMYADGMGIFEGLVHMGPNGQPVAGAAKSWGVSKDGKVWTFHLRNERFSNGDPVTASDWLFAIKRAVDPKTATKEQGNPVVINDLPIQHAQDIRAGNLPINALGVKAVNSTTLQLTLDHSDSHFLRDLTLPSSSFFVPVDQHVVTNMNPSGWAKSQNVISNGPYMLKSYTPKTSAVLVPNPYYWGKVKLKEIDLLYSATNQLLVFKNGSLDMAQLGGADVAAVNADPSLKQQLHWWPTSTQYSLEVLPSKNTTLLKEDVRRAFAMAVDKDAISKGVLKDSGAPAYEYFSPTWLSPWIKSAALAFNPKEARSLLAKAGYPGGKGFPTVELLTTGQDPVAQAVQQMWQQNLGVHVNLVSDEWGQFVTAFQKQFPANEVGYYVWSTNSKYPELMLPQSVQSWVGVNTSAIRGYASPAGYQKWMAISNDKSMDPAKASTAEVKALWTSFPQDVKQYLELGIKASQTGNEQMMREFYTERAQRAYDIPIYTPLLPVLLRSGVKGYNPDDFLDVVPPYWLNDITR